MKLGQDFSIQDVIALANLGAGLVMKFRQRNGQPLDPVITAEEIRSASAAIEHEDDILGPAAG